MSKISTVAEHIHIRNKDSIEVLLNQFLNHSLKEVQIISDFDGTMTPLMLNGEKCPGCYRVIEECDLLDRSYHDKVKALQQKYYPLEINPAIPFDEKYKYMVDWWKQANEALVEYRFSTEILHKSISQSKLKLRDGVNEFLSFCENKNVSLLIFSAGLTQIIEEVLRVKSPVDVANCKNIKVISNKMIFNNDGIVIGFEEPQINSMNKNIGSSMCLEVCENKKCYLVIGDNIGDCDMIKGIDANCVLKIGYLNDMYIILLFYTLFRIDERLTSFMEKYDIVITNDESFEIINELVKMMM